MYTEPNMITALDPGVTTGIAGYRELGGYSKAAISTGQLEVTHRHLYRYLRQNRPSEIVYESFIYQRRNKVILYPVEVIGIIKLYAEQYDIPIYTQSASQAKGFITDDKIKKMGLWIRGQKHGMDALRHLLYHLIVTKGDRTWLDQLKPD